MGVRLRGNATRRQGGEGERESRPTEMPTEPLVLFVYVASTSTSERRAADLVQALQPLWSRGRRRHYYGLRLLRLLLCLLLGTLLADRNGIRVQTRPSHDQADAKSLMLCERRL